MKTPLMYGPPGASTIASNVPALKEAANDDVFVVNLTESGRRGLAGFI
jgi:hypothetical protein